MCLYCCGSDRVECGQGTFTLRLLAHSCRCTRIFGFDFQLSLGNGLILFKGLWRLLNCACTYKYVICWYDVAIAYPVFLYYSWQQLFLNVCLCFYTVWIGMRVLWKFVKPHDVFSCLYAESDTILLNRSFLSIDNWL